MSQNPQQNQNTNNINNNPQQSDEKFKKFFYNTENLENIYNILKGDEKQLKKETVKKLIQDFEGVEYDEIREENKNLSNQISSTKFVTSSKDKDSSHNSSNEAKENNISELDEKLNNSTWRDFKKAAKGKTIVGFGSGFAYKEFFAKYGKKFNVPCILENNRVKIGMECCYYKEPKDYWKDKFGFVELIPAEEVKNWEKDKFVVIITSTMYQEEMAKQLKSYGFENYFSFSNMETRIWYNRLYSFFKKDSEKYE